MPAEKVFLITGGAGFVGSRQSEVLSQQGHLVRCAVRSISPASLGSGESSAKGNSPTDKLEYVAVGDIGPDTDWSTALRGVGTVIHLAGRAHVTTGSSAHDSEAHRRINSQGTLHLARAARESGVGRFVFASSVHVNGVSNTRPYREDDKPAPSGAYAQAKWEAECGLRELNTPGQFEVAIVRSPLVYGAGVKGNFLRLLRWVDRGIPLPFAGVKNRRSFIGLENLVSFLSTCALHPAAGGETFLASDGEDMSTPELISKIAQLMGHRHPMFYLPESGLRIFAHIFRKQEQFDKLCGSLTVDLGKAHRLLDWQAPQSVSNGLAETVKWYRSEIHRSRLNPGRANKGT